MELCASSLQENIPTSWYYASLSHMLEWISYWFHRVYGEETDKSKHKAEGIYNHDVDWTPSNDLCSHEHLQVQHPEKLTLARGWRAPFRITEETNRVSHETRSRYQHLR
jgi:hypothetical protein